VNVNYRIATHENNHMVVTAALLETFNDKAIEEGYNRTLMRSFFNPARDEDGATDRVLIDTYPIQCTMAMPHYHKEGVLTLPHVRTMWTVPSVKTEDYLAIASGNTELKAEIKWLSVSLDVTAEMWEQIPTVKPYAWLDIPEDVGYERKIYQDAEAKFANDATATIEDVEQFLASSEKDFMQTMRDEKQEEE